MRKTEFSLFDGKRKIFRSTKGSGTENLPFSSKGSGTEIFPFNKRKRNGDFSVLFQMRKTPPLKGGIKTPLSRGGKFSRGRMMVQKSASEILF